MTIDAQRRNTARPGDSLAFELSHLSRAVDAALRNRTGGLALASLAALGMGLAPGVAQAATITVTSTADNTVAGDGECTLREAIANANAGADTTGGDCAAGVSGADEIVFDSSVSGTIALDIATYGNLDVAETLTISGPGADTLTVDGQNTAPGNEHGGILRSPNSGTELTVTGLTLANGKSNGLGGAIFSEGPLNLGGVTIRDSEAAWGGGCFAFNDTVVKYSTVTDNSADLGGGGIGVVFGNAMIAASTLSGNIANSQPGGGLYVYEGGATIAYSTVSGNQAPAGGGFFVYYGDVVVTSSTVSGNTSTYAGGGFFVAGSTKIAYSTVSNNTAGGRGGGGYLVAGGTGPTPDFKASGSENWATHRNRSLAGPGAGPQPQQGAGGNLTLVNTIFADNTASGGDAAFHIAGSLSASYSLVEGSSTPPVTGGVNGNIAGVDPGLGPLQDNGGPTLTHAITAASPAFNAGDPSPGSAPDFDQRGPSFPRVVSGRIDMGAYELQAAQVPVSLAISATTIPEAGGSATLSTCLPSGTTAAGNVTVTLAVSGSATPGTDHNLTTPTTVTIPGGATCGQVSLVAFDDTKDEPDETVVVNITAVGTASDIYVEDGTQRATATITDDDAPLPVPALGPLGLLLLPLLFPVAGWRYLRKRLLA